MCVCADKIMVVVQMEVDKKMSTHTPNEELKEKWYVIINPVVMLVLAFMQ